MSSKTLSEEANKISDTKGVPLEMLYEESKSTNRALRIALASREAELQQMAQQVNICVLKPSITWCSFSACLQRFLVATM